jgi:hypothetical protein
MLDAGGVVWSPEGISPGAAVELGGGGIAARSPECISPAEAVPESTHARATANVKCLILGFSFEFEDANLLARKQHSVNTYAAIDTASGAMTNIRC